MLALLPLLLFALDLGLYPELVESRFDLPALSVPQLLSDCESAVDVGTLHLHRLRFSCGGFADFPRIAPEANALAVAVFPWAGSYVGLGAFGQKVFDLLPDVDRAELLKRLDPKQKPPQPGSVQVFERQRPHPAGPLSKIDYIFIVHTVSGADRVALEALRTGLLALFAQAERKPVSGLLLPCLTISPNVQDSPSFDDFFKFLFAALHASSSPRRVQILFFKGWATDFLKNAAASFNDYWTAEAASQTSALSRLYRFDLRLLLLALAACLLACSFQVRLNLKSFVILAGAFTLTLLGLFKAVDWTVQWFGEERRPAAMAILAFVEAVGFPYFVRWNARDLFSPRQP